MKIILSKDEYRKDFFFDSFMRKNNDIFSDNSIKKISFDISDLSWLSDFQLSLLPFVFNQIKTMGNGSREILVNYLNPHLFEEDENFDYLFSAGFYQFLEEAGMKVELSRICNKTPTSKDELIQFQSFKNLSSREIYSQNFWYSLSASLSIINNLLKNDALLKTDIADRLSRVVTKELIENINLHSGAELSLVRIKYERNFSKVFSECHDDWINQYFETFRDTPFFILTVSDNGEGIIKTLKSKYRQGDLISKKNETWKEIENKSNSWWIKKAFSVHKSPKKTQRSRYGLSAILKTVEDYNGLLYARTADSAFYSVNPFNSEKKSAPATLLPHINGTHFVVYLPAIERKKRTIAKTYLYRNAELTQIEDVAKCKIEHIDITYSCNSNIFPFTKKVHASHTYSDDITQSITEKLEKILSDDNKFLEIDFSNASNARVHDYIHILQNIYERFGEKFPKKVLLRNLSQHFIELIVTSNQGKELINKLEKNKHLLLLFDSLDRVTVIGVPDRNTLDNLKSIVSGELIQKFNLDNGAIKIIANNDFFFSFATINGNVTAYSLPFSQIFLNDFTQRIDDEFAKSKSIIKGHFLISDSLHVDNYLIANLMFQNPIVCRSYAKQIAIRLGDKIPDILFSYATTGIIIYLYLKKFYYPNLHFSLVNGPSDVSYRYGDKKIKPGDKIVIVTDVKASGAFEEALVDYCLQKTNDCDSVIGTFSIFDINTVEDYESSDNSLFWVKDIKCYEPERCHCIEGTTSICNVSAPESRSILPSVYQRAYANIEKIRQRSTLMAEFNKNQPTSAHSDNSLEILTEEEMTPFQLQQYWKDLQEIFQLGHVERNDIHFDHYDIPERLLFKAKTAAHINVQLKQFAWSFNGYIDFVIYPKDLTAAYLAHLAAGRFLKKPIVAEARRLPSGYLTLPGSISDKLKGKKVMIVDDACNTGLTLRELIGLIELYKGKVEGVFTIINRLSPENEITFKRLVPKISSAYSLNLSVFARECPLCKSLEMLKELRDGAATNSFSSHLEKRILRKTVQSYQPQ